MNLRKWIFLMPVSQLMLSVLMSPGAEATTISAVGGLGFIRSGLSELKSPPPLLGAEYMFDAAPALSLGGFFNENFLSYKTGESGTIRYLGIQGRMHFLGFHAGPFADVQAGLGRRMQGENSSGNQLSFGGGVGYEIPMGMSLSLSPRMGVRVLPDSISGQTSAPMLDGAVMLSLRL